MEFFNPSMSLWPCLLKGESNVLMPCLCPCGPPCSYFHSMDGITEIMSLEDRGPGLKYGLCH